MGDWDPPFPIDLGRIRPADEAYWDQHRATPKAFVSLARGQQLWRSRFGQLSSVRVAWPEPPPGDTGGAPAARADRFAELLRAKVSPEAGGFVVAPVRASGLDASTGSTDFGQYFVYFSFFLIAAAVLLAALFFRLGVEQRVREIGTLQAVGFPSKTIRRLFLLEGAVLSGVGGLAGTIGAVAYGGALVAGLRSWWVDAVGTRQVFLHVSAGDLAVGAAAGAASPVAAWASAGAAWRSRAAAMAAEAERRRRVVMGISPRRRVAVRGAVQLRTVSGHRRMQQVAAGTETSNTRSIAPRPSRRCRNRQAASAGARRRV